MRLLLSAAFLSLTLAPACAADLFGAAPPMTIPAEQAPTAIEIGSNWYFRGDLGVSFADAPSVTLPTLPSAWPAGLVATAPASSGSGAAFTGDLGFGYRYNSLFRMDATWTYWTSPSRTRSFAVVCPYRLQGISTAGGVPAGYLYDRTNACAGTTSLDQNNNTFLATGYVDLGTYYGFTPYVGAGAGVNVGSLRGASSFIETATGAPYLANLANPGGYPSTWVDAAGRPIFPAPGVPFTAQNWNRSINSTTYRFAWTLAAGFGFQLTPSAILDLGYRYINAGQSNLLVNPATGLTVKNRAISQQILVGVRYLIQ